MYLRSRGLHRNAELGLQRDGNGYKMRSIKLRIRCTHLARSQCIVFFPVGGYTICNVFKLVNPVAVGDGDDGEGKFENGNRVL